MLNLDTNILLFAAADRLRADERRILASDAWGISAIVLWEIEQLSRDGRAPGGLDAPRVRELLQSLTIWPLDIDVCRAIRRLDFRSDPADEIIAATSLVHDVPLVTRDQRLLISRVVPLALP